MIVATDNPMVPAETTELLEGRGFKIFISTEVTLEAGDGVQVLQVIHLDTGEYRVSKIPQSDEVKFAKRTETLPENGEVLKWLDKNSQPEATV